MGGNVVEFDLTSDFMVGVIEMPAELQCHLTDFVISHPGDGKGLVDYCIARSIDDDGWCCRGVGAQG